MSYEIVFKRMPLAACLIKEDLSFVNVNDAFETGIGFAAGQCRSLSLVDLVEAKYIKRLEELIKASIEPDFEIAVRGPDNTFTWKGQAVIVSSDIFFLSGVLAVKDFVRQESIQVILDEKVEVICGDRPHLSRSCSNEQSVAPFIRDSSTFSSRKNTCIKLDDLSVHVTTSDVGNGLVSGLRQKVAGYHSPVAFMSKKQLSNGCISARSRGKILVVNDSPISRKVLLRALEKSGFSADIACDGQEACDKMSNSSDIYNAVLMDLRISDVDQESITKLTQTSKIPIIIVTAEMGESVDHFLNKPALVSELINVLGEHIQK